MKLYIVNTAQQKVYLNLTAATRSDLQRLIGADRFSLGPHTYNIRQVYAEMDSKRAPTGLIVGGAVGALAGPLGILFGGILGGIIGNGSDKEEIVKVERFNRS